MRYILIFMLIFSHLWADKMDYKDFKLEVLKQSKTLKSSALLEAIADSESELLLLSKNPSLDISLGRYNPEIGDDDNGFSGSFSQSIRTSNYYNALKQKAKATKEIATAKQRFLRANFLKNIELLYTEYVYAFKQYMQLQSEYELTKKITSIAYEQYKHGTKSKTHYLQAKNDELMVKTTIHSFKLKSQKALASLFTIAGVDGDFNLEKEFIYSLTKVKKAPIESPTKALIKANNLQLSSEVSMSDSSIKSFDINGEFEKEPEQDIARVGVSFDLPIFNNSSQRRELLKLKTIQAKLNNDQKLFSETKRAETLLTTINSLIEQVSDLRELERTQKNLVELFKEGYKISKGSLLELISAKKSWIMTQNNLLKLQKEINNQKIELFYLQGKYND